MIMKIFRLFTIAAAALILSACSEDIAQMINGGKKEFTATLAAPNKGGTRTAYNESGGEINVAWTVGDKIALVHNGVKDVVTVTAVDNTTGKATINGYINNAINGSAVTLVYPAALVQTATGSNNYDPDLTNLRSQDGTLGYIQENIDFREDNTSTLSVDGTGVTLSSDANLSSKIAILKLTLKDNGVSPATLNATQVKINKGTDILASTATIAATSEVYLAVPSVTTSSTLTIEATVEGSPYTYTKESITVAPQKYYQSTVNLSKTIVLSTVTAATTIEDGYTVTGTLGANVKISIAAGATVTLDGISINAEGTWTSGNYAGITCAGDATIILKDGSANTVKGFQMDYPGILAAVDHTLIIKGGTEGTGSLEASSNRAAAGIGGGWAINCGNIEIQGGIITANGGGSSAGIGTGYNATCGTITISGGSVTAKGGESAAGIGSGSADNEGTATCGNITISGGTVDATGDDSHGGAGIGCGRTGYAGTAICGDILISGGTVEAKGGGAGAGIGSGITSRGKSQCGNITISGGTVTATGYYGSAGIGSSLDNSISGASKGGSICGNITINGGTVTATGSSFYITGEGNVGAAAIGSGVLKDNTTNGHTECGTINITSAVTLVTATKGADSPNSIGAGYNGTCGTVTIGGTVYWDGSAYQNGGGTKLPTDQYIYPTPPPSNAINGKFTIASGKQVYFAKGNLQATYNGSKWSWGFAANQWDRVGDAAANNAISGDGTVSANGTVDLFRWVGVHSTHFTTAPAIYGITNESTLSYFGYVTSENLKSDWGTLIGAGWRTLTKDEWDYLLKTRTVNGGTGAGKCFTYGQTVNDILGLVIYPDGYTGSAYAGSDWATFEAAGCVFLPAAGYLWQNSPSPQGVNSCIYYWTATSDGSDQDSAFRLTFDSYNTFGSLQSTHRNRGNAVRLAYDIE